MSEADKYPDYDFSFLDGATGIDLAAIGRGLDDATKGLELKSAEIADTAQTATVDRVQGELSDIRKSLATAATDAAKAAAAFQAMKAAWDTWKANAPRHAELVAAEDAVTKARADLIAHSHAKIGPDSHVGLYRMALKHAEAHLRDLITRRESADEALEAALEQAKTQLLGKQEEGKTYSGSPNTPPAPPPAAAVPTPPAAPAPGPSAPAPGASPGNDAPAPAPAAPGGELPSTATPPAPETSPSAGTGSADPSTAAALAALLGQQQQQPQAAQGQPQGMPAMPTMPQVPMAQQKPDPALTGNDAANNDLVDLLNSIAPAPVPVPMSSLSGTTPSVAVPSLAVPETITPATPWNTPGALSALPPLNPVTTGTSLTGLTTDTNVTGRADGATARSATSPASHLSASSGAASANSAAQPHAAMGAGMPMMPMGGPMMGGPGGGNAKRDTVKATLTSDQAQLLGLEAVAEAVPGGTIAQKKDGAA